MGNLKRFIHFQCYNLAYFKWQNIFNERNKICANYTDDTAQMSKYEFRTCDHVCVCVYVMFQYVLMRQSWTILWPCEAGGLVANSVRLLWPHGLYPPGSSDMEFPKQEYWSGLPFPSPGDLPDPGIEAESPALQADSVLTKPPGKPNGKTRQN